MSVVVRFFIAACVLVLCGCRPVESTSPARGGLAETPEGETGPVFPVHEARVEEFDRVFAGRGEHEDLWDRFIGGEAFRDTVRARLDMEEFVEVFYKIQGVDHPQVVETELSTDGNPNFTRYLLSERSTLALHRHEKYPDRTISMRGYRAPVLGDPEKVAPVWVPTNQLTVLEQEVAAHVDQDLLTRGLLPMLVDMLERLGPEWFSEHDEAALQALHRLGLPVDWLDYFHWADRQDAAGADSLIRHVAAQLAGGVPAREVEAELSGADFRFRPSHPGYAAALESGQHGVGLLRMQMGGGYFDGIVHGGSIDLIRQMVAKMPEADFLVSVPADILDNVRWLARRSWPLQRTNQLTVIGENLSVAAWAQDNGKAGVIKVEGGNPGYGYATLIPRYASADEVPSRFMPGESFLMAGVASSGHEVVTSPLLFQGGNLLVVQDPATSQRVLLLGEAELHRNLALGLSRSQVLEAFRVELGVDRCVPLPAASFHIDYDVSVRMIRDRLTAFVNDIDTALSLTLQAGLDAMAGHNLISMESMRQMQGQLRSGQAKSFLKALGAVVYSQAAGDGTYPETFSALFGGRPTDVPTHNLQCFLVAMDVLASRAWTDAELAEAPESYRAHLRSLRLVERQLRRQQELIRGLGWRIVAIPSMPDFPASINYLNGVHSKGRFLMPVQGGFYAALDEAAMRAMSAELGEEAEIVPIVTSECQKSHGAVHCATAAYPDLAELPDDS